MDERLDDVLVDLERDGGKRGTGHDPPDPLRRAEDQADKDHGGDDRGREEVGELAPAIDDMGTFEHAECVCLQAVRAVTARHGQAQERIASRLTRAMTWSGP